MTNTPDQLDLEGLESAAKAATPGPWLITDTESSVSYDPVTDDGESDDEDDYSDRIYLTGWQDIGTVEGGPPIVIATGFRNDLAMTETSIDANAQFIAAWNPATALSILSRLRASEAECAALADLQNEHANITQAWREAEALATSQAEIIKGLVAALETARDDLGRAADLVEHSGHREVAMRMRTNVDYIRAALSRTPAGEARPDSGSDGGEGV